MLRRKHRKDYNHGKSGWVGGNARYRRTKATVGHNRTMGRAAQTAYWK